MLSCSDYDYIEIACLYKFNVELYYRDERVVGVAVDTQRNAQGEEGIVLVRGDEKTWYPLDNLLALAALTPNPHFDKVEFDH